MKKHIYESPEMEIVRFDTADIITASGSQPGCEGVGPTECPTGGSWNGGGCTAGGGSSGTKCDGQGSDTGGVG